MPLLWITTPDSLDATTVRVLMPGGLEPVDPNTAGGSTGVCEFLREGDSFSSFPINCPDQVCAGLVIANRLLIEPLNYLFVANVVEIRLKYCCNA